MEDAAIIEGLFRRDSGALEALEQTYGSKLLRLALRFLNSREDAEEAVNDTWLAAWNTIPPQRPDNLPAYLSKLCRFAALGKVDWLNARKRRAAVVELTRELEECVPDPAGGREAERLELTEALDSFLAGLPREKRVMFLRRYWYGDPVKDISARLGVGESKVKTSLFRLRKTLKTHLEQEGIAI